MDKFESRNLTTMAAARTSDSHSRGPTRSRSPYREKKNMLRKQDRPVLVLQGFGMFDAEDCFVSKAFRGAAQKKKIPLVTHEFKDGVGETGTKCKKLVESAHERFRAIVVADLSDDFDNFHKFVTPALKVYVREHNWCVLFPTCEGMMWADKFLQPAFGDVITWKADGFYRAVHAPVKGPGNRVGKFFPGCTQKFSVKSATLIDVPTHERCFATGEGSQLFGGLYGDAFPSEEGEIDANGDGVDTSVAVASGGDLGGTVAFFGDLNAEPSTMELMSTMLETYCCGKEGSGESEEKDCFSDVNPWTLTGDGL
jgi:hypothetical protein